MPMIEKLLMIMVTNHGHDHDNYEKRVVTQLGDFGQVCDLDEGNHEGG